MRARKIHILLLLLLLLTLGVNVQAYNHPELEWRTIEGQHFRVHYHQGSERTARLAAQIAEEIYEPITSLYDYPLPKVVDLIIYDTDDYSNGMTYYFENKIAIWATQMDWELRGTHHWLRNVITHEFTHMVTLQLLRKFPQWLPALYIQHIGYEEERRPDVVSGYPNVLISYPLPGTVVPLWFAEGVAQYQTPSLEYETWDSHRDMLLRMATLGDNLLSYDDMGGLFKGGLGSEMVYNQGFSLSAYIAEKYQPKSLQELCRAMRNPLRYDFGMAVKKVLGKSEKELYREWRDHLVEKYQDVQRSVEADLVEGRRVTQEGWMNIHPAWSPDGGKLAYLSNKGSDYQIMSLYVMDVETEESELVTGGLRSAASWAPDGKTLIYAKRTAPNKHGNYVNDIYRYDLEAKKEKRLTYDLRAVDPRWSPDGQSILAVLNADGTHNLALLDTAGSLLDTLTDNADGTQYYGPRWSPSGERILTSSFCGASRDIGLIAADESGCQPLIRGLEDERNPCWAGDGEMICFASDRGGIFNLYTYDLEAEDLTQVTNVVGGAFNPSISPDGETLAYSGYTTDGYQIFLLPLSEGLGRPTVIPPIVDLDNNPGHQEPQALESRPYKSIFTQTFFLPRFVIDDKKFKGGLYLASQELLNKQSAFATAVMATDGDFDLYAQYENRMFAPSLFFEAFRLRKNVSDEVYDRIDGHRTLIGLETRYDLTEFDLGIRYAWSDPYSVTYQKEISLAYIFSKYDIYLEVWTRQAVPSGLPDGYLIGKDSWTYFRGHDLALRWDYKSISRARDSEINPRGGREIHFRYDRLFNKLINPNEYKITEYGYVTAYYKNYYDQFELDWKEYRALPFGRHTLVLHLKGGVVDKAVDDFFYLQAGSQEGLRGYSFYSIEGRKIALGGLTYRFPIWRDISKQLFHVYFDKLYGSVFFDAGKAWNDDSLNFNDIKRDVGGELRLDGLSYYAFPTKVSFAAAYGLDDIPAVENRPAQKGGWRFYFNLLFNFIDSNGSRGGR
ncbi:BamA/TamA family outer membrane protein [Candidatus Zixiibacteriota bacterium]